MPGKLTAIWTLALLFAAVVAGKWILADPIRLVDNALLAAFLVISTPLASGLVMILAFGRIFASNGTRTLTTVEVESRREELAR
ncbi:MAG: hypothetical protein AAFN70_03795 [Planctomycetota bacterium]